MKISTTNYSKSKQAILPLYISDYLDICDPVLVFDRFMEGIDLEKYLKNVPKHITVKLSILVDTFFTRNLFYATA